MAIKFVAAALESRLRDRFLVPDGVLDLRKTLVYLDAIRAVVPGDDAYSRAVGPRLAGEIVELVAGGDRTDHADVVSRTLALAIFVTYVLRETNGVCQYTVPRQMVDRVFTTALLERMRLDLASVPIWHGVPEGPDRDDVYVDLAGCPTLAPNLIVHHYSDDDAALNRDQTSKDGVELRAPLEVSTDCEFEIVDSHEIEVVDNSHDYDEGEWPGWEDNVEY